MSFANMTLEEALKLKKMLEGTNQFANLVPSNDTCMHNACPQCNGTGVRKDGGLCIHGLACTCSKCSPKC